MVSVFQAEQTREHHVRTFLAFDLVQLLQLLEAPQNDLSTKSSSCCSSTVVFVDCNMMGSQWMCTGKLMYHGMLLRTSLPQLDIGITSDRDHVGSGKSDTEYIELMGFVSSGTLVRPLDSESSLDWLEHAPSSATWAVRNCFDCYC